MATGPSEKPITPREKLFLIGVPALMIAVALGIAYANREQPRYYAKAVLKIVNNPKIIFDTSERRGSADEFRREMMTMIKSRTVLNAALGDPELVKLEITKGKVDPIAWLSSQIQIKHLGGEYVEVGMEGDVPKHLPVIVNAVSKAYMTEVVDRDQALREKRLAELQKIWGTFQDELKAKREMIRKLAEKVGSDDKGTLALMQQYVLENQARIQREMLDLDSEIRKAEGELAGLKSADPQPEPSAKNENAKRLAELAAQIQSLTFRKARLEKQFMAFKEEREAVGANTLDQGAMKEQMSLAERAAQTVGAEIEAVKVELHAPKRVELFESAITPTSTSRPRDRK